MVGTHSKIILNSESAPITPHITHMTSYNGRTLSWQILGVLQHPQAPTCLQPCTVVPMWAIDHLKLEQGLKVKGQGSIVKYISLEHLQVVSSINFKFLNLVIMFPWSCHLLFFKWWWSKWLKSQIRKPNSVVDFIKFSDMTSRASALYKMA